jgi:hypothetical protein
MSRSAAAAIALLGLALSACATVPMASPDEDKRIKSLVPPNDAGLVYLYRNESFGGGVHMDVTMDGWPSGQTGPNTFMVWQVVPGTHVIVSKAENDSTIGIDVRAGQRYFVWQEVKMGALYARSKLQLVSEREGMKGVNECQLVKMPVARPRPAAPPPAPAPPTAGAKLTPGDS